jgi:hypothetical protein
MYFPAYEFPSASWQATWLRWNPLSTVLACFEHVASSGEKFKASDNLCRKVTAMLRDVQYVPTE